MMTQFPGEARMYIYSDTRWYTSKRRNCNEKTGTVETLSILRHHEELELFIKCTYSILFFFNDIINNYIDFITHVLTRKRVIILR